MANVRFEPRPQRCSIDWLATIGQKLSCGRKWFFPLMSKQIGLLWLWLHGNGESTPASTRASVRSMKRACVRMDARVHRSGRVRVRVHRCGRAEQSQTRTSIDRRVRCADFKDYKFRI